MADDMEALEFETAMQNLRQAVYDDLKILEHPIEVNQFNICKLMQCSIVQVYGQTLPLLILTSYRLFRTLLPA